MTKQELRILYKEKRLPIGVRETHEMIAHMVEHFQQIPVSNVQHLLSFKASTAKLEVPVHFFEAVLREQIHDLIVAYPKADFKTGEMEAFEDNDNLTWEETGFGIEQPRSGDQLFPSQLDMVLVPLLAFDEKGYRVGYGKGFYDRYLKRCEPGTIAVGVSLFDAVPLISDSNEYDVPLTYCVTPQRLYVF